MNRREILLVLPGAVAWPLTALAQQPARTYTILWVSTEAQPDPFIAGFREGMRERGYVEGQNLSFVLRYAPAAGLRGGEEVQMAHASSSRRTMAQCRACRAALRSLSRAASC